MTPTTPKIKALVFLSFLGIFLCLLFAYVNLERGFVQLSAIKIGIAAVYGLNLVYLLKTKNIRIAGIVGFILTTSMLLVVAHIAGIYAFFWIYALPPLAFFLFGLRGGTFANVLLFATFSTFLFTYDSSLAGFKSAQLDVLLSYLVVAGFSFYAEHQKEQFTGELTRLSYFDPLTGAYNRRMLPTILRRESARTDRYGSPLCAIMIDIDYFKKINDRYGHFRGDEILQRFSEIARANIRSTDYFVRYGGDEFLILVSASHLTKAREFAEKIRRLVKTLDFKDDVEVTVSAGVAEHLPGEAVELVLHRADKALYRAKHSGRNCVVLDTRRMKPTLLKGDDTYERRQGRA